MAEYKDITSIKEQIAHVKRNVKSENGILYCGVSGKIILPQFENIPCCRGKYKGA